jgi:hypothetical protein
MNMAMRKYFFRGQPFVSAARHGGENRFLVMPLFAILGESRKSSLPCVSKWQRGRVFGAASFWRFEFEVGRS